MVLGYQGLSYFISKPVFIAKAGDLLNADKP